VPEINQKDLVDEMDQVNEHFVVNDVKVKMLDLVDEFLLGLNEDKLLYSEECQN
jgi:hypothetical protein